MIFLLDGMSFFFVRRRNDLCSLNRERICSQSHISAQRIDGRPSGIRVDENVASDCDAHWTNCMNEKQRSAELSQKWADFSEDRCSW
jgi:hypothetical protein